MFFEIVTGAILLGSFIYHRWFESKPSLPAQQGGGVPLVAEGSPIAMIYGRCRVSTPILAWSGNYVAATEGDPAFGIDMLFVIGIPFFSGQVALGAIWAGDIKMNLLASPLPVDAAILANTGPNAFSDISISGNFFSSSASQNLSADSGISVAMTRAGVDATLIPGYRNFACVAFLANNTTSGGLSTPTNQIPSFAFEVRSLSTGSSADLGSSLADDADPAAVIYDLLTSPWAKLALPANKMDRDSFVACSAVLFSEQHGYSRSFEQDDDATNIIGDVLKQIDGVLYEEPANGKLTLRLVRADYDVNNLDDLNPTNARPADSGWYQVQGWSETINQVRVTYSSRDSSYADAIVIAQDAANVVNQGGKLRSTDIQFPGCCTPTLANRLAARELAAISRPQVKASVIANRTFASKRPGDVVTLTWPELGINKLVMRIARVDLGQLHAGAVSIDMVRDTAGVVVGAFPSQ